MMIGIQRYILATLILLIGLDMHGRDLERIPAPATLLETAVRNFYNLDNNFDLAMLRTDSIISAAEIAKDHDAELWAIRTQCAYHKLNDDYAKMLETGQHFLRKADAYRKPGFQAIALKSIGEAYLLNNLLDHALEALDRGMARLEAVPETDTLAVKAKGDLWVAYANQAMLSQDMETQLKYIRLSGRQFRKVANPSDRAWLLYVYNSNMAGVYNNLGNMDSVRHYALLSESLDRGYPRNDLRFVNRSLLGRAALEEGDYRAALAYIKAAEHLSGYHNFHNIIQSYRVAVEAYDALQLEDSARLYRAKQDSLLLTISQSQKEMLYRMLDNTVDAEEEKGVGRFYILLAGIGLGLIVYFLWHRSRKAKTTPEASEIISPEIDVDTAYAKLSKMVKDNDPMFTTYFDAVFPEFFDNLSEITSELTTTDKEFCALFKLKIPTKEIARYKFISPKTVQNRKHLVRKKLEIPSEVDLYAWFDDF